MAMLYRCLACERAVNLRGWVLLVGQCGDRRILLALSTQPGDYTIETSDGQPLEPGTQWELFCPLCGEDLSVPFKRRMARLELIDENGRDKVVMFSKIADEQATFVMGDGNIEPHGKDSRTYMESEHG